jgi:CMP-N,N'-diacetyllegionaminic acid synthase
MLYVLSIIPARSGSKGVTDKNIKLLSGIPLFAYSIAASIKTDCISRTIVSTDSEEYAEIAQKFDAEVPFLRPKNIAGDGSSDYLFVKHALDWLMKNEGELPEYIVHLRPTTPLRKICYIGDAVSSMIKNSEYTALRSVHKMSESAYKMFEIENAQLRCVCSGLKDLDRANDPRQTFPDTYLPNGYVDVLKTDFILKHKCIHGNYVYGFVTPFVTEVDTPEDFEYLEYQLQKRIHFKNELFDIET